MFATDAIESLRRHVRIPDTVGIDDEPGALLAKSKTLRLRSQHRQHVLLHLSLDVLPSRKALNLRAATRAGAEEQMLPRGGQTDFVEGLFFHESKRS